MQSKKVMVITLIVFVLAVAVRLKDLLPDQASVAVADTAQSELTAPGDIILLGESALGYMQSSIGGAAGTTDKRTAKNRKTRPNPFDFSALDNSRPIASSEEHSDTLGLQPIAISPDTPICSSIHLLGGNAAAIVDGIAVSIGDPVRDYTVKRIDAGGVLLVDESEYLFLPLQRKQQDQSDVWIALDRKPGSESAQEPDTPVSSGRTLQ